MLRGLAVLTRRHLALQGGDASVQRIIENNEIGPRGNELHLEVVQCYPKVALVEDGLRCEIVIALDADASASKREGETYTTDPKPER